jgi:hypothetical protein
MFIKIFNKSIGQLIFVLPFGEAESTQWRTQEFFSVAGVKHSIEGRG